MLLGFTIESREDLEAVRHFASCPFHFQETVDALLGSIQNYLDQFDAGQIQGKNFIGVSITPGTDADQGGDQDETTGTPSVDEAIQGLLGSIFGNMPRTDPRMN